MNTILCIGDSITAGWPYGKEYAYSEYLKPEHITMNSGIPGETVHNILMRFERELISSGADTVMIMAGTNDALSGNGSVSRSLNSMRRIVQTARKRNVRPVVLTCMIPDERGVPEWFEDPEPVRKFLEQYNTLLTEYCRDEKIGMIGTHIISPGYTDGVHPDKTGYRILGQFISSEFRKLTAVQQQRTEDTQ